MTKKFHNLIDFCLLCFPLLLIALNIFRQGQLDFTTIESDFAIFRQLDFGITDYFFSNTFPNLIPNSLLYLMCDLMIYFMYWRLFDLLYSCVAFFIDIIRKIAKKWGDLCD